MEQEAKTIAQENNANIDATPNGIEQQEFKTLSQLPGDQFDKAYMNYGAAKQQKDLRTVQQEETATQYSQIKSYVYAQEAPYATLRRWRKQSHLDLARIVRTRLRASQPPRANSTDRAG